MNGHKRDWSALGIGLLILWADICFFPDEVRAQGGARVYQCTGSIGGVPSEAALQIEPGGIYGGPYVAGWIRNRVTGYRFNGELFGGNEGFISLVDLTSGERIDRVRIGIGGGGFILVTEDGARYRFRCRG